jgi:ribosomal protein S18 acetylase RimI-like enzyme
VLLRPAAPTLDEGALFAGYLDRAAEGFFRFMLGRHFRETIAAAYVQPAHDLSFEYITCAELEGEIVGMASAYTAGEHRLSTDRPLKEAPGYPRIRSALVTARPAPILRFLQRVDEGDSYLQAIAVDSGCRGSGVGSTLIAAVEERARAQGSERLCLDVSAGNPRARRLYERLGLSVVEESPALPLLPRSRVFRMAKAL